MDRDLATKPQLGSTDEEQIMDALKSTSVHILLIGAIVCSVMYRFTDSTITLVFATAFAAIVAGRKGRDMIQSSKGTYYDTATGELKKIKDNEQESK